MKSKALAVNDWLTLTYTKALDYLALTKPRLLFMVVITTATGFYLPLPHNENVWLLLHVLIGTSPVGGGANVLNQWYEVDADTQMFRTRQRPIPSGKLTREEGKFFGLLISFGGMFYLVTMVNWLTLFLGFLTWASYLFLYTPLKRRTVLNTWIGAITGALPPVMGWAASEGTLSIGALPIFAILYFWQLPHFFAISWMYQEDYRRGGFQMLSLHDPDGIKTGRQMLANTLFLGLASLFPFTLHQFGMIYLMGALFLGGMFLGSVLNFVKQPGKLHAKWVFMASIVYLPLLLMMMIVDQSLIVI